jgi:protein O-mannosyl-transferase
MTKLRWIVFTLFIAGVALYLYLPALTYGYIWDDWVWLEQLRHRQGGIVRQAFFEPFMPGERYWRPVGALTLYLQPAWRPEGLQHLFNIVLHLANLSILSALIWRAHHLPLQSVASTWGLLLLAIFALHPAFVEPVVWVSGRFDLMFTTVLLLSIAIYWLLDESRKKLWLLSFLYMVGLLAKESAILLLPMILLFGIILQPELEWKERWRRDRRLIQSFVICSAIYFMARAVVLADSGLELLLSEKRPFLIADKLYEVFATIGAYLRLLVFPFLHLSMIYPEDQILANTWYSWAGGGFIAVIAGLMVRSGTTRVVALCLVGFLLSLTLVLNIIPEGFTGNLIQNRYLYPAMAYLLVCITASRIKFTLTPTINRLLVGITLLWLIVAALNVRITVPMWRSQDIFNAWLVMENPDSIYARNLAGVQHIRSGDMEAAIKAVGEATSKMPNYEGYMILSQAHYALGRCGEALVYFDYAYQLGAMRHHKADALLGKYSIYRVTEPDNAVATKEQLLGLVGADKNYLDRILQIDSIRSPCAR